MQLEQLTEVVVGLPVAAILTDMDGVTIVSSAAAPTVFGATATTGSRALMKRSWFRSLVKDAEAGRTRQTIRVRLRTRSSASHAKVAAITLRGGGRPSMMLLVAVRLGGLRSDLRYRRLLDDLLEPVAVHVDSVIRYANSSMAELLGLTAPELVGRSILDFVHPDYRGLVIQRMRMVKSGHVADLIEGKLINSAGAIVDVEVRATRVRLDGQHATQVLMRDVTRRKQMEAGLQASQQRYRMLTESVRDHAVVATDSGGIILSWNAAAAAITGFGAEDVVGESLVCIFSVSDAEAPMLLAQLLEGATASGRHATELWARHKDSSDYWASAVFNAMRDPEGKVVGYTAIIHDLTRQREIESKLRRSEEQLRHAQKMDAIGRLAAGIAHDFKNLLTAIHGHAQFLMEDLPHNSALLTEVLEIRRAADRAGDLTKQLLTFARKQDLHARNLDVNEVVAGLEKMLRRLIRADVELQQYLGDDLPTVLADRGQIEQVIMNLVVNARDAIAAEGRITVRTTSLDLDDRYTANGLELQPGRYALIGVTDTGIGMDADTQRHIFEPFFTTKREGEGTGLGLATVYGIVRQTGGHVSVYSEPGKGTTVKIFLPAAPTALPREVHGELSHLPATGGGETILLVEDDGAIRALAARVLRARGYTVLTACDGMEALALLRDHDGVLSLLVTDLMMPGMSGGEVARQVRVLCPHVAVIFMSGFSQPSAEDAACATDAVFLEKPFAPEDLVRRVAELLERSGPG